MACIVSEYFRVMLQTNVALHNLPVLYNMYLELFLYLNFSLVCLSACPTIDLCTVSLLLHAHHFWLFSYLPGCMTACLPAHMHYCLYAWLPACMTPACRPACLPACLLVSPRFQPSLSPTSWSHESSNKLL
jgi:hypothetical protein